VKPNQGLVLKSSAVGRLAAFFTIFLFLTSCGGGGGGAGPSSPGSPPPSPGVATTPVITMQPAPASVPVYRDATFTVAATGNGMLSYQWYAGYGFPEITSPITGATSPTLTLRSVTVAVPARSYYCVVTNTLNGTTATATSIQSLLTVLAQRSTVTLSGESAVLPGSAGHVVSTPAQSGVTYSWTVTNGIITSGQGTNQVTYTAGSLGQGPSQSAGIAYGEKIRGSDKRVYCLLSDGELQEGNVWEAAMFAGHHKLDNLVFLIDNNDLQAGGHTKNILSVEPVPEKFEAFGFKARRINGNSVTEILGAFDEARNTKGKPYAMVCDTRLFHGSPYMQERFPTAHYMQTDIETWKAGLAELENFIAASSRQLA